MESAALLGDETLDATATVTVSGLSWEIGLTGTVALSSCSWATGGSATGPDVRRPRPDVGMTVDLARRVPGRPAVRSV